METLIGYHSLNKKGRPNEDRFRILGGGWIQPDERPGPFAERRYGPMFAVMDGVGGAPRGMAAAQRVADRLVELYRTERPIGEGAILALLSALNLEVHGWGLMEGSDRPLGATTATLAWLAPDQRLRVFHVGDSAALLRRGEHIAAVTQDHGSGAGVGRYLGQGDQFVLDRVTLAFGEDDALCLVTDGVTKGLNRARIGQLLTDYAGEPGLAARQLVEQAARAGVQDDITALVVELL